MKLNIFQLPQGQGPCFIHFYILDILITVEKQLIDTYKLYFCLNIMFTSWDKVMQYQICKVHETSTKDKVQYPTINK
jgi:hypothetical protein